MNIEQFTIKYQTLRDIDKVLVDDLCDHSLHQCLDKKIGKGPAKRNILKHGGKQFICRDCDMRHNNPMNRIESPRQTNEMIAVICPQPSHEGDTVRYMQKACYYGEMVEPYLQICQPCSQRGKIISEEQKEKIRKGLSGRHLTVEHRLNIVQWWAEHPDDSRRQNLKRGQFNPNVEGEKL